MWPDLFFKNNFRASLEQLNDPFKFTSITRSQEHSDILRMEQSSLSPALLINNSSQNIIAAGPSAAQLYYEGNLKLQSINTGVQTTGTVNVNGAYTLPTSDGSANQILETDGSGTLSFVAKPTSGASAGFVIAMAVAL